MRGKEEFRVLLDEIIASIPPEWPNEARIGYVLGAIIGGYLGEDSVPSFFNKIFPEVSKSLLIEAQKFMRENDLNPTAQGYDDFISAMKAKMS